MKTFQELKIGTSVRLAVDYTVLIVPTMLIGSFKQGAASSKDWQTKFRGFIFSISEKRNLS